MLPLKITEELSLERFLRGGDVCLLVSLLHMDLGWFASMWLQQIVDPELECWRLGNK